MDGYASAEASIAAATSFLGPVLTRESISKARGQSIIDRLFQSLPNKTDAIHPRTAVLRRVLELLLATHRSLVLEQNARPGDKVPNILNEPKVLRTIYGLLDIISLEGIYPSLSPGVGVPLERRVKSVLPAGVITRQPPSSSSEDRDLSLLQEIVDCLLEVYPNARRGISPICQERILVDLTSACGELAFGPNVEDGHIGTRYTEFFKTLVDEYVSHSFFISMLCTAPNPPEKNARYSVIFGRMDTKISVASTPAPDLLPLLTSLLLPTTPVWLRPHLLVPLSLIPLRPSGVRHTIEFIASTFPLPPETQNRDGQGVAPVSGTPRGPALPFEALTHASRLLSSVPSHLPPQEYFSRLAPQLFDLLGGQAGPEMGKVAAFVITSILGRKAHGAPGEAGWSVFAEPLFSCIDPSISTLSSTWEGQSNRTLVPESELELAVNRLTALTVSHPNPGLTKRLLGRAFLPLWGLLCFAKKTNKTTWYDRAVTLIQLYLKLSAGEREIVRLAEEILFDGRIAGNNRAGWVYGPGSEGGIELRQRPERVAQTSSMIEQVDEIDSRVREFVLLLSSGVVDDRSTSEVFLTISRRLLQQSHNPNSSPQRPAITGGSSLRDPLQALIGTKIVQGLLEISKEKLAEKPTGMFELIKQVLEEFVERSKTRRQQREELNKPSLTGLGNIVQLPTSINGATTEATARDESIDIVSTGLSLLVAILTSFDSNISKKDEGILASIENSLEFLSSTPNVDIPIALSKTAVNLLSLLSIHSSVLLSTSPVSSNLPNPLVEDKKTYSLALSYLGEALVPVRVQGLHLLETLIQNRSPLLDIQATSTLLLSLLQDEDEFIYLNVIKTLTTLADRHGNAVTKTLVERYVDRGEDLGLDQRLKLGEALLRIVQRTGTALVEGTAQVLGEGMIDVAGRRGRRLREMEERQRLMRREEARNREAEQAWGGEVPQIGENPEEPNDKEAEVFAKIVMGWESKDEEDTRIRTSALSIYGAAVETNAAGLGSQLISTAIDLAISILTMENQEERAILRRAAAMLILSVLKALDEAEESGRNLGFGFAGENLAEVITVLRYVQATDNDGLAREYAETIVKELETWRVKSLVRASSSTADPPPGLAELEGGRLAGLPFGNPRDPRGDTRPYIEEIE
ncbi:MAG: hypothetical protein M1839_003354 [Geoglossum umbratile]|nr:MAG: hypothetical protein M1839_003354 [Geoglossum umbratile]